MVDDTPTDIDTTLHTLDRWTQCTVDNEWDFLETFAAGNPEGYILVSTSWDANMIHYIYIIDSCMHITDSSPIVDWLDFYERHG